MAWSRKPLRFCWVGDVSAGGRGSAAYTVVRLLEVDLIIIGRHGRRGLATLILGSVAEQIAKIATASVLLVRKH
ncbi:MAG: universal stress protein [Betaproteobacteria bacterium]|nr:universal stress protein [Betaproteobacteria bacterium]